MAIGTKRIETRSWGTKYRGALAIHAAQKLPTNWSPFSAEPFRSALEPITGLNEYGAPELNTLPRGCVVAIVTLVDVITTDQMLGDRTGFFDEYLENERPFGDYSPGRFAWLLADVTPLEVPIAAKGSLSLWEWDGAGVSA